MTARTLCPDREALVVGMALVPGLYSRNRMFALFADPEVRRARARAGLLRGVVRQLAGAQGNVEVREFVRHAGEARAGWAAGPFVLRFAIPPLRFIRRLELTELEAACVAYLCDRAGVTAAPLVPSPHDRALLDDALRRLSGGLHLAGIEALAPAEAAPGCASGHTQVHGTALSPGSLAGDPVR